MRVRANDDVRPRIRARTKMMRKRQNGQSIAPPRPRLGMATHTDLIRECGALAPPTKAQCRHPGNWGLVRFLKAVAQEAQGKGKDQWSMVLRRAAKGLSECDVYVVSTQQALVRPVCRSCTASA